MKQGLMMLAHGSKVAETDLIMTQYVDAIKHKGDFDYVEKAYLQLMAPDMEVATKKLYDAGVRVVYVFPFFLFNGNHIQEDIPAELERLKTEYTDIEFKYLTNIGFDDRLVELVVNRIAQSK